MRLNQRFRRLVFAQILLGIVAFGIAEKNPGLLLVAGAVALLSRYVVDGPGGRSLPRWFINIAALGAVGWLVFHMFGRGEHVVVAMGHFTIWLQVLLLYMDKSNRDYAQLLVLSLLTMIGASILSISILYGVLLVAYCVLGLVTLVHFHYKITWDAVNDATRKAAPRGAPVLPIKPVFGRGYGWHTRLATLAVGAVSATVAVAVFIATPRAVDSPTEERLHGPLAPKQTAFSNQVNLASGAPRSSSQQAVLTMTLTLDGQPITGEEEAFLLRGAALDSYDPRSQTWSRSLGATLGDRSLKLDEEGLDLAAGGSPESHVQRPASPVQDPDSGLGTLDSGLFEAAITLRQTGYRVLFAGYPATFVGGEAVRGITFNPLDHQLAPADHDRGGLHYTLRWPARPTAAHQQLHPDLRAAFIGLRDSAPGDNDWRRHYARGWRVEADRIRAFTQSILQSHGLTRDVEGPLHQPQDVQIAHVLADYLRSSFRYSLANPVPPEGRDATAHFLLEGREGHCELFAAGLAAMTRSIGMQTRIITGYRVSEYNAIGGYHVVREANAHAWNEINLGPALGWQTFDATPPEEVSAIHAPRSGLLATLREVYEVIEYEWIRSVVAYDQNTRQAVLTEVQASIGSTDDAESRLGQLWAFLVELRESWRLDPANYTILAVGGVALVVAIVSLIHTLVQRRRRLMALQIASLPRAQRRGLAAKLRFYLTMLEMLERHGYIRPAWQTPSGFAQELAEANPLRFDPVIALTDIFYEIRFGHRDLDPARRQRIKAHLKQLEHALASPRN